MVWPFTMSFAALLCVVSMWVGNGHALRMAAPILGGYLMARVIVNVPLMSDHGDIMFSVLWLVVATSIPLKGSSTVYIPAIVRIIIYMAVACVMWGSFGLYEFKLWSTPYAIADTLVIVAMLLIGWTLRHDVIDRISELLTGSNNLAGNHSLHSCGRLDIDKHPKAGRVNRVMGCEKGKEIPVPKVRAHG